VLLVRKRSFINFTPSLFVYICSFQLFILYLCAYTQGDIFGCVADVGWVTGHTYAVYGPLLLGTHTFMHFYTYMASYMHIFSRAYVHLHSYINPSVVTFM
jgi:acyl-coenzyme A synthetase/AMP-(fatty) acid ligase